MLGMWPGSKSTKVWVVATLLSGLVLSACSSDPEPVKPTRSVKAMQIIAPSSLVSSSFPGRAEAGQEVNLSFRVAGPLVEFPVNVGDSVNAGDIVARLDPTDYQSTVAGLEGQLQSAQAAANRAQADLERIENTFREDPGATTEMALDRARQLRDSTAGSVRGLAATVKGARDQLSYTELRAPFSGEVVETYIENFETVIPKQAIVRVVDPSSIEFSISVSENQIVYAPYVTGALVSFDALPGKEFIATIKEISKEATQATRTYPVTLSVEPQEGIEILPGMAGEALIEAKLPEQSGRLGIQIPTTALFAEQDPEISYVWVINQTTNTLERRAVVTGQLSEFGILIKSGLEAGEWVVIAGATLLSEGDPVTILGARGESAAQ